MVYEILATTKNVAERYGVTASTVRRWVRNGVIPCIRASRRVVRFRLDDVDRALQRQATSAAAYGVNTTNGRESDAHDDWLAKRSRGAAG